MDACFSADTSDLSWVVRDSQRNLQKTGLAHAHIFPVVEWLHWITTRGHWIYHHSQWVITLWLLDGLWNAANLPTDGPTLVVKVQNHLLPACQSFSHYQGSLYRDQWLAGPVLVQLPQQPASWISTSDWDVNRMVTQRYFQYLKFF